MGLCYLAGSHKVHDVPKCGVTPRRLRSIQTSLQQRLELLSSPEEDHWGLCLSLANDLMQKCDKPLDVFASNQGYDFFLATSNSNSQGQRTYLITEKDLTGLSSCRGLLRASGEWGSPEFTAQFLARKSHLINVQYYLVPITFKIQRVREQGSWLPRGCFITCGSPWFITFWLDFYPGHGDFA